MPSIPLRLDGLLFKRETTHRVDSVPTAAVNGVKIAERLWPTITVDYAWENLLEDAATGTILPTKKAVPRGRFVELNFAWLLRGAGVDAPPETGDVYRACGCTETDGVTLFDYTQASQLHESGTAYAYAAGYVFKIVGCRGGFRWPIVPGQVMLHRFRMLGLLSVEPAPAAPPQITYDTAEPLAGVGLTLAVGSWVPRVISAEFNQGVEVQRLEDANDADGIEEFDYGIAQPTFALSARVPRDAAGIVDLAAYDPFADLKAAADRTIVATGGATQFNRAKLVNVITQLQDVKPAENSQFAAYTLQYRVRDWTLRFD